MAITFAVSAVEPTSRPPVLDWRKSMGALLKRKVEGLSTCARPLVGATDQNALAMAVHDAFYGHFPLVLTPDAVWFTLAQGFALHVNQNVELLRERFVQH